MPPCCVGSCRKQQKKPSATPYSSTRRSGSLEPQYYKKPDASYSIGTIWTTAQSNSFETSSWSRTFPKIPYTGGTNPGGTGFLGMMPKLQRVIIAQFQNWIDFLQGTLYDVCFLFLLYALKSAATSTLLECTWAKVFEILDKHPVPPRWISRHQSIGIGFVICICNSSPQTVDFWRPRRSGGMSLATGLYRTS